MPKLKLSSIMIIFLGLFVILDYIGYRYIIKNIKTNHKKDEQILFYKLEKKTSELLAAVLYEYSLKKADLRLKHKEVMTYIKDKDYKNISLDEIYKKINKDEKAYDIYISDENFKIVNTTFKPDLGFDLSFAKENFQKHRKENIIGISAPIFKTFLAKFFSYTDEFIGNSNSILQVSYKYSNVKKSLEDIQNLIEKNNMIVKSNAFIIFKDGYIGDFIFKSFKPFKQNIEKIKQRIKEGKELSSKVEDRKDEDIIVEYDGDYKVFYFLGETPIFDEASIVFSMIFSDENLKADIKRVNIIVLILSIVGIFFIVFLFKIRSKELLLSSKDRFIKHSVHEIKTPLSIISLNNQLRDKKLGRDKYSIKIQSAIKTLQNSYDDMSYLLTKNVIDYEVQKIKLEEFLEKRIDYFQSIASSQGRILDLKILDSYDIKISEVELTRLIDNNLSNAIKYSDINSKIEVILEKNILKFISMGDEIRDKEKIFRKYKRENNSTGGNGLGLSIVWDICKNYDIKIEVISQNRTNSFIYTLN